MSDSMFRIETPRLIIRDFAGQDFASYCAMTADMEVMKFLKDKPGTDKESSGYMRMAEEARTMEPRTQWLLAVESKEGGEFVGTCMLNWGAEGKTEALLAVILSRSNQGRGLGTEIAKALIDFSFKTLNLLGVWGSCKPDDKAGARMLEKAGMGRERTDRVEEHVMVRYLIRREGGAWPG